ncbi:MAG TPA: HepT-like ribonuclease domain-containing protein [Candidatus Nanopelagicaceae bacterium]|nr:HepT-like ribonuclease domain-containing protein [Candidatus Nanopelagicaceae bacterium]
MSRSDGERLEDIFEAAEKISGIVGNGKAAFDADEMLEYALRHLVQIIGESARALSEDTRQTYPEIDWRIIIRMRHVLVHLYHRVDIEQLWDTAQDDVPALMAALRAGNSTN